MKLKKTFSILTIVIIGCLALSSCSKKLDRDKAKELILQKFNFPQNELQDFPLTVNAGHLRYNRQLKDNSVTVTQILSSTQFTGWKPSSLNALGNNGIDVPPYDLYERLQNAGLITYKSTKVQNDPGGTADSYGWPINARSVNEISNYDCNHYASFTEKGNKYVSNGRIIVATIEFGEITGIVEGENNTSEVNYNTIKKATPFGEVYNISGGTFNHTAKFAKYDDGWRIK